MAAIKTLCNSLPAINTFFFFFFGQPARTRFNWWLHFLRLTVGTFSSFPHLDWTCTVDCEVTTQHYRLKTFSICWVSPLWSWMVCSGSCPLLWCWFFFFFSFFPFSSKVALQQLLLFPVTYWKKKKKRRSCVWLRALVIYVESVSSDWLPVRLIYLHIILQAREEKWSNKKLKQCISSFCVYSFQDITLTVNVSAILRYVQVWCGKRLCIILTFVQTATSSVVGPAEAENINPS